MRSASLDAYIHEFRVSFPIAVDRHDGDDPLPPTMRRYAMQGTPTLVLIGRDGAIRDQVFGQADDLTVDAAIGRLVSESQRADSA